METRVAGYECLIGLEIELKHYSGTSFKLYDLGDLHKRINSQPIHLITLKIKESGLAEANGFPMVVHAHKLAKDCIERYNLEMIQILFPGQSILLSINKVLMQLAYAFMVQELLESH